MRIFLFVITLMLLPLSALSQHTQTNAPQIIFPLIDDYIKQGYERNYRAHTRILKQIDFVYLIDIPSRVPRGLFSYKEGDITTVMIYEYYLQELDRYHYVIAINEVWYGNPYVMRRLFYKAMAMIYKLTMESDSVLINTQTEMYDFHLIISDLVEDNWNDRLDIFYQDISASFDN